MRVVITAGGTREPIDAVRVVANTSTGRLGARIAEAAAAAGHQVVLLAARIGCDRPAASVETHVFDACSDLARLLDEYVPAADAVIHAAAVSDYIPEPATGKLSSDSPELVLRLRRAPKLIDGLRRAAPRALIVGFKLLADADEQEQVARASELLRRARLDLVVVNDLTALGDQDHAALLVDADGVQARAVGKTSIARALVSWLGESVSREVAAP